MRDDKYLLELADRFPNLYYYRNGNGIPMGFIWGEIDNGWFGIIERLSEKLETLITALPKEEQTGVKVTQVKQKFGGLRFYYQIEDMPTFGIIEDPFNQAIRDAEEEASNTCEICGLTPAQTFGYSYIRTLCLNHKEEYLNKLLKETVLG